MGRRKIEIRPIQHERNRAVTFLKRKTGLFKKAYELSVLCSIDIAVIIFEDRPNANPKCYEYSSTNVKDIVNRHVRFDGERDTKGAADFAPGSAGSKHDDDDDEDDEDSYGRKRSLSYMKSGGMGIGSMNPDYPMLQPPMPMHPSLPSYQPPASMRSSTKKRSNDYRPYPDTGFRSPNSGTYGSSGYYDSTAPTSGTGNPYPSATSTYNYPTRPHRSHSTSALTGPATGSDYRQISNASSGSFGGIVDPDPSARSTSGVSFPPLDWPPGSGSHSHSSSTGQSPAMANATLNSNNGPGTPTLGAASSHHPSGPGQETWLNINMFNPGDASSTPSGGSPGDPRRNGRDLPDIYGDHSGPRVAISRHGRGDSGGHEDVKREPV